MTADPLDSTLTDEVPRLAPRALESHKNTYGRAVLIGGSLGMSGAITLSGLAALRGGAGLVQLGVPDAIHALVAGYRPEYMVLGLPDDDAGRLAGEAREQIALLAESATALALGPGLGRSPALTELVSWLYTNIAKPLIIDADGLNALADEPDVLNKGAGPRILTPHPGEFSRLVADKSLTTDQQRRRAVELARDSGIVIVLKGHRTLVTDGQRSGLNQTGNPGMATGGTGDVLTGLITALVGQRLAPWEAARLGVHLHGRAGDLAAARLGQVALLASDLIDHLPAAFLADEATGRAGSDDQ